MKSSYLRLFSYNFMISAFTFGGGYVTIPMMEKYFVDYGDLSKEELLELSTIAQTSPGAIAVNLAVLVGHRIYGWKGAVVSALASTLPALIILYFVSLAYTSFQENPVVRSVLKGMEAAVAAIIVDLVIDMTQALQYKKRKILLILPILTFFGNAFLSIHPLWLLGLSLVTVLIAEKWNGGVK
ncbi:chromate transporter [uncultured Enterococcus sp.]|uniref:chromate transporter n=1 Tax=uncultured Enterococcus sp. TaxID=167972 RepID=UPI002AA9437F|nr:chromate transporter [uncultured Enterococcus sp.]